MSNTPNAPSDEAPGADDAPTLDEEALRQRVLRNPAVRALIVSRLQRTDTESG